MLRRIAIGIVLALLALPAMAQGVTAEVAAADPIVGRTSVIDGATLEIRGTRIRLHGIDAPESGADNADAVLFEVKE